MEIIYTSVGLLFVTAISLAVIAMSVGAIFGAIHERKNVAYSDWARNVCGSIDRWCDHEFPQVGFMAREINNSIAHGWSFDVSSFRDKLRNKYYEKKT